MGYRFPYLALTCSTSQCLIRSLHDRLAEINSTFPIEPTIKGRALRDTQNARVHRARASRRFAVSPRHLFNNVNFDNMSVNDVVSNFEDTKLLLHTSAVILPYLQRHVLLASPTKYVLVLDRCETIIGCHSVHP